MNIQKKIIHLQKIIDKKKMKSKVVGQIHDSIAINIHKDELEKISKIISGEVTHEC